MLPFYGHDRKPVQPVAGPHVQEMTRKQKSQNEECWILSPNQTNTHSPEASALKCNRHGCFTVGLLVDREIVWSTRYGKTRVFINKTLSTETAHQQDLINRDLLSTSLIVVKVGPGMWCGKFNSTSNVLVCETQRKVNMYGCVIDWVGSVCVCVVCVCPLCSSLPRWSKVLV